MKQLIVKTTGLVTALAIIILVQQGCSGPASFDKALMEAASELNKTCPIMVDKETRLDNAIALPGNVFQYNYTLVNIEKADLAIEDLRNYLEPNIVTSIKTNPELKMYRDNNVTMAYNYKDKNGEFLTKIEVTPGMYKK